MTQSNAADDSQSSFKLAQPYTLTTQELVWRARDYCTQALACIMIAFLRGPSLRVTYALVAN